MQNTQLIPANHSTKQTVERGFGRLCSTVTASSEPFGASPHSDINALAVAISFSFVFVLITLFKLRFTQSIYFIELLLYKNADVKCLHNKCYGTLVHMAVHLK